MQTDKAGPVLHLAVVDSQFAALVALVDAGGGFDRMLTHPVNGKVISEEETSPHVVGACMVVVGLPPDGETEYVGISEAERVDERVVRPDCVAVHAELHEPSVRVRLQR